MCGGRRRGPRRSHIEPCPGFVRIPDDAPAGRTLRTIGAVISGGCGGATLAGPSAVMIARPHDALFKSAFEAPADAAALLRELLPVVLRDLVAWDTLHGEPASFVDPDLADLHCDL